MRSSIDPSWLQGYFDSYTRSISRPDVYDDLIRISAICADASGRGKKVIFAGNGGSAAIASHCSVDLTKTAGIRAVNFNEADLITCLANDYGYAEWLAQAVGFYGDSGDVVVLISSSGQSPNIIAAAVAARRQGLTVITLSGFDADNPLRKCGDINLWIDSHEYNIVEMTHHIWLLAVVDLAVAKNAPAPDNPTAPTAQAQLNAPVTFESDRQVRVLVTGGAGFIGSHLVDRLLERGYRVVCIDNFTLGRREHLTSALANPAFTLHDFDLLNVSRLDDLFAKERFDIVFHLAANSDIREGTKSTNRDLQLTFLTTYNVLESMRRHGVSRILFTSTPAIFGKHAEALHEDSAARPESLYGASKLASEGFISAFSGLFNIQAWICRLSNIVGERQTHGIIYDLMAQLDANPAELQVLGDGTQSKPYMYVHEIVAALLFVIDHSNDQLNIFNIGPRDSARVADIARLVLEAYGGSQKIAYTGGPRGWQGDVALYRYSPGNLEALGWGPPPKSVDAVRTAIQRIAATR